MAGNKHPWRDVMSFNAWQQVLIIITKTAPPSAQDHLGKIGQLLQSYHALEKQSRGLFTARIQALEVLKKEADQYLQEKYRNGGYKRTGSHKGVMPEVKKQSLAARGRSNNNNNANTPTLPTATETSIDRWVYSLAQRAQKKADYLRTLSALPTMGGAPLGSFEKFLEYLQRKNAQSSDSPLLSLVPGVKPEKWDPFHRPIEVNIKGTKEEITLEAAHPNAIGLAFIEWYNSRETKHFFEWLEGHPICTFTKYLDQSSTGPSPFEFGCVQYGSNAIVRVVSLGEGLLYARPFGDNFSAPAVLTTREGKKTKPGEAYVWLNTGELLIHPHHVGTFHHSSFDKGSKVRCAGTMDVQNGKITRLDNNSGHYRPSTRHFLTFLEILNARNVLDPRAHVSTHDLFDTDPTYGLKRPFDPAGFLTAAKSLKSYPVDLMTKPFYKVHK